MAADEDRPTVRHRIEEEQKKAPSKYGRLPGEARFRVKLSDLNIRIAAFDRAPNRTALAEAAAVVVEELTKLRVAFDAIPDEAKEQFRPVLHDAAVAALNAVKEATDAK